MQYFDIYIKDNKIVEGSLFLIRWFVYFFFRKNFNGINTEIFHYGLKQVLSSKCARIGKEYHDFFTLLEYNKRLNLNKHQILNILKMSLSGFVFFKYISIETGNCLFTTEQKGRYHIILRHDFYLRSILEKFDGCEVFYSSKLDVVVKGTSYYRPFVW